jgi:hypothetical protein
VPSTPPDPPRVDLDIFDDDPDDQRRRPREEEIDDLFSSGFVSGEELFDLETGGFDE